MPTRLCQDPSLEQRQHAVRRSSSRGRAPSIGWRTYQFSELRRRGAAARSGDPDNDEWVLDHGDKSKSLSVVTYGPRQDSGDECWQVPRIQGLGGADRGVLEPI